MRRTFRVGAVDVPPFLYGTAWKEDDTTRCVIEALEAGYRGIDTANQRKHYHEAGVGEALQQSIREGAIGRDDLFIQTKFTHVSGQDHRLPYDPSADPETQVRQSCASSLQHLGVDRLDSYLIHGPEFRSGLSEHDRKVWQTMEQLHHEGAVRLLGISNVTAGQIDALCDLASVPPAFVQNRCYAQLGWDRDVRRVCRDRGVLYQGFSLLTANVREMRAPLLQKVARAHGKSEAQIVFRFAHQLGMICLTGTTDPAHMREDLDIFGFELEDEEMATIERVGES